MKLSPIKKYRTLSVITKSSDLLLSFILLLSKYNCNFRKYIICHCELDYHSFSMCSNLVNFKKMEQRKIAIN